jgi:energy-coupling factor transporter transmembrane protein EcfT
MKRSGRPARRFGAHLKEDSPLRGLDPRSKLFMVAMASLAVMLPIERLAIFMALYLAFLLWARLFPEMIAQVVRLKWVLILIFLVDWWVVNLALAGVVTLRLVLLAGVFTLFFATTTPGEMGLAFERFRVPYRFSFSINLVFQSLDLLQEEWNAIREAQKSRGILPEPNNLRGLVKQAGDLVALTVPAIVLVTRRAWATTEAAYSRGFDSPKRAPYLKLRMRGFDGLFMLGSCALWLALMLWR